MAGWTALLRPVRRRQLATGLFLPFVMLFLICAVAFPWFVWDRVEPVPLKLIAVMIMLAPIVVYGFAAGIRGALYAFCSLELNRSTTSYQATYPFGPPVVFRASELIGYSDCIVGRGAGASFGVILYLASGKHVELSQYAHKDLDPLLAHLEEIKTPHLGHERSWWLFLNYRYDPK